MNPHCWVVLFVEHVSCVFHQPPSFSKDDGTTSRKKKRSTEEEPDGKKKRLSLPSSQEPELNDASDSGEMIIRPFVASHC